MSTQYDLIIIGGGCAGLSLALNLSYLKNSCPKILILESKSHYSNDKTWCFWGTPEAKLKNLSQHKWTKAEVSFKKNKKIIDCDKTPYCFVPADIFFEHSLAEIAKNKHIQIQYDHTVSAPINKTNNLWVVNTGLQAFETKVVLDTRPSKHPITGESILWQSFYGAEIICEKPIFDPNRLILMDFVESHDHSVNFNYILPLTTFQVLIEFTVFSAQPIPRDDLDLQLNDSILKFTQGQQYKIVRRESGILPMGLKESRKNNEDTYIEFGLFSGAARPSTGYAFQRIQLWAEALAKNFEKTGKLGYQLSSRPVQIWMDTLFLRVIANNPEDAPKLFLQMFKRCNTKSLIRFLSEQGQWRDYISIICSLSPWPFLKQLGLDFFRKN